MFNFLTFYHNFENIDLLSFSENGLCNAKEKKETITL